MHTPRLLSAHLACFASLALLGCGEVAAPTVDVTGIWRGDWDAKATSEEGFCTIELLQEGARVTGKIYLRYAFPALGNIGVDVEGTVEGASVRFKMQSTDNPHTFYGDVGGEEASGTIDYGPHTGQWSAQRIESKRLTTESSFELQDISARSLTMVDDHLWVNSGSQLTRIDQQGDLKGQFASSGGCQHGVAYDGTDLLCSGGYPYIVRRTLEGEKQEPPLKIDGVIPDHLAYDGQHLWVGMGAKYTLYQADLSGQVQKELVVQSSFGDHCWGDGHLWQLQNSPQVVFQIDTEGQVVAGYHLPKEAAGLTDNVRSYPSGLAFADGGYLWVGVTRIDLDAPGEDTNYLFKLKIP